MKNQSKKCLVGRFHSHFTLVRFFSFWRACFDWALETANFINEEDSQSSSNENNSESEEIKMSSEWSIFLQSRLYPNCRFSKA